MNGDIPYSVIAAVVIFMVMAAVVAYSIKKLASTPVRLVAVIGAVAGLVTAVATLIAAINPANVRTIDQPPPTPVTSCVAPLTACPPASPAVSR